MFVTCYLDESATDGGSPQAVVAGVLMNESYCVGFDEAWSAFLAKHDLPGPFHMKDFQPHGCLAGLSSNKRAEIFSDAVKVVNAHKLYSIGALLDHRAYREAVGKDFRDAMGAYGLCFFLAAALNAQAAAHNSYQGDIAFVLDVGNPEAEHAREAHKAMLEYQRQGIINMNVGTLAFDDDTRISALQGADLVAWAVRRRATGGRFGNGFEPLTGVFDNAHVEDRWSKDHILMIKAAEAKLKSSSVDKPESI